MSHYFENGLQQTCRLTSVCPKSLLPKENNCAGIFIHIKKKITAIINIVTHAHGIFVHRSSWYFCKEWHIQSKEEMCSLHMKNFGICHHKANMSSNYKNFPFFFMKRIFLVFRTTKKLEN